MPYTAVFVGGFYKRRPPPLKVVHGCRSKQPTATQNRRPRPVKAACRHSRLPQPTAAQNRRRHSSHHSRPPQLTAAQNRRRHSSCRSKQPTAVYRHQPLLKAAQNRHNRSKPPTVATQNRSKSSPLPKAATTDQNCHRGRRDFYTISKKFNKSIFIVYTFKEQISIVCGNILIIFIDFV